jgi:hypothetical protein
MTNENRFKQAMAALAAVYQNAMQAEQIAIYWDSLGRFNPDHLDKAVKLHIADTKDGKWFPKPAHLISHINELMAAEKRRGAIAHDEVKRLERAERQPATEEQKARVKALIEGLKK